MTSTINYSEVESFIRSRYGREFTMKCIDINSISISVPIQIIGNIKKNFSLEVKYLGFDGPHLKVQLLNHKIGSEVMKVLVPYFSDRIADIVTSLPDNIYVIDFSKIDKASAFFNEFDISSLKFHPEDVNAEISLKGTVTNT